MPEALGGVNGPRLRSLGWDEPSGDGIRSVTGLPKRLPIRTRGALDATLTPPGSKSLTNRALPVAALARGQSTLRGGLVSDDTRVMLDCLAALGHPVTRRSGVWTLSGGAGRLDAPRETLYAGNSGTTARFLAAAATLADGPVVIDGNPRMRERPIAGLVDALQQLGAGA